MFSSSLSSPRVTVAIGLVTVAFFLAGCGDGDQFETAPVSGTVTLNGEPVTAGTIMLSPISDGDSQLTGKGAAGPVQEDGSFVLTTYEEGDGAILGKHRLAYAAPMTAQAAPAGAHGGPARSPYYGAKPKTTEVEITSSDNVLEVELTK